MSSPQEKTLDDLREELRIIQVFDRVHELAPLADSANERAHAVRQARRKQIIAEIADLKVPKSERNQPIRITGAVALACAIGYAMLAYVLR